MGLSHGPREKHHVSPRRVKQRVPPLSNDVCNLKYLWVQDGDFDQSIAQVDVITRDGE